MPENISIAAIGTSDSVILFNSIGVKTYVIVKVEEVDRIVFELYKSGCKIIYFDEEIYDNISDVSEQGNITQDVLMGKWNEWKFRSLSRTFVLIKSDLLLEKNVIE